MPIQAPQWTEFLSCPVCYNVFNEKQHRPISLACGHTVCKSCLSKLQQRKCPFDQSLISRDIGDLPVNFALLQLVCATAVPEDREQGIPKECRKHYEAAKSFIEELALLLKPVSSASTGSIITPPLTSSGAGGGAVNSALSRPMQRKLITLVNCQLVEEEGRSRAVRAARSLGERTVTELILQHQNPQQLSSNLWAAVRGRGCQFLGPAMQEEVLHLILLALEDGSALSRKVLVLFVVQRLECQYPQASKTAIGHVVQLLYRASCFMVTKRDQESSLMQLKEEYRSYETLRREHDTQIVQIAMEAGLRIAPDQWSSLLYGDSTHKSHMQSIIDKLQTPQTFSQSVSELLIALQRTGDPHSLQRLRPQLEFLSSIDPSPDVPCPSWENLEGVLKAAKTVVEGLVSFLQNSGHKKHDFLTPFNNVRYKTSMCRDLSEKGHCPRGSSCTFAHSEEELERYRQRNKKAAKGGFGLSVVPTAGKPGAVSALKQEKRAQSRRSLENEDQVEALMPQLQSYRLEENNVEGAANSRQGAAHSRQGVSHNGQGATHSSQGATHRRQGVSHNGQGATNSHQGATHSSQGANAPTVAAVTPNVHRQHQHKPQHPSPSGQVLPGQPPEQQSEGQAQEQGHQMQGQTPQPGYQGHGCAQAGNPLGQVPLQPGYQGQVAPQPRGMSVPPTMPPPNFEYMGFPGGAMGRGKYPIPVPMNPMMYMYPGMPPYMPYYHPGYMPPGGLRYPHFDGYRPQLNPYAEPWSPHSQQQFPPGYMAMTGQNPQNTAQEVNCTVCSQRKQQNSSIMTQHGDLYPSSSGLQPTGTDLECHTSDLHTSRDDHHLSRADIHTSAVDLQTSRTDLHDSVSDLNASNAVPTATISQVMSTTNSHHHKTEKNTASLKANQTTTSQDAIIQRQSLSNLKERRNSLLAMLKDRQKTSTATVQQDCPPESESMRSYRDLVERMKGQSSYSNKRSPYEETLEHPVPRDSGPPGLKSADPTHSSLFKRLGAISGMPPRSVNDSIMASWMTATLTAASSKNTSNIATTAMPEVLSIPQISEDAGSPVSLWNGTSSQQLNTSSSLRQDFSVESSWNGLEEDYPYWNDISRTMDSPSPQHVVPKFPILLEQPNSTLSQLDVHPSITNFFSQLDQDQEDIIPFDPPIISKFGPISRLRTKSNNTVPLKVTADEMMKTIPVTVVTPLSRPPLPNATTVPSRFIPSSSPSPLHSVPKLRDGTEQPEPYSLWRKEVVQLERKAQEANTVDERLSVELQAVEMQISMKQQELQEVCDVQFAQRQASQYIQHRQPQPSQEESQNNQMGLK